ncbi:MAG: 23S rRNA (guanosine(2251)-2'-O)-methyltransferase RlmB [Ignavibacteria bacterium]|jgi:23S rRNA (guanosine2251-2'-O)-methyltransferase
MFIIGRNPIIEALRFNPSGIKRILILENPADKKIKEIIKYAEKYDIVIERNTKIEFEKYFDKKNKSEGISQGIAAEVSEFKYSSLNEVMDEISSKENPLIIILDEIQDPHNLGAIIRTGAASGADAVIISEKNSAGVNHTVIKSSSGAVNYIKIVQSNNIYKTILYLKENSYRIIGTSLKASKTHYDLDYSGRISVMFGNEGEGLRKNLLKLCDELIKIPINSKIESLNVSVAAGVILFEALRQRTV